MANCTATILLPTTGDRGPLLPYSIGSIQRQTVTDFELFVIGDGVTEATRQVIQQLMAKDDRIRFFDHPKHPRRGEVYRHAALAEARGQFVAYLCDRDLWLPEHLAVLGDHLQDHDFVATGAYDVNPDYEMHYGVANVPFGPLNLELPAHRRGVHRLSAVGHSLVAYQALPEGWRTTPEAEYTDRHMWRQFLAQPGLRAYA
ncbi:MAG: glycosyltransferase family A protein, partial [Bacteroidota bacterium]